MDFDFDEWARLAREDPDAFEARRSQTIEAFISSAPEHETRLRALQWRIDMERRRHGTALGSCLSIYRMMWDSVYGEHGLLEALETLSSNPPPGKPRRKPKVLAFRAPGRAKPADGGGSGES